MCVVWHKEHSAAAQLAPVQLPSTRSCFPLRCFNTNTMGLVANGRSPGILPQILHIQPKADELNAISREKCICQNHRLQHMAEPRSMHQPFPSWFVAPNLQHLLCKLDYKWKVAAPDIFPKQHLGIWMGKANFFTVKAYISVLRRTRFYFWLPASTGWANTTASLPSPRLTPSLAYWCCGDRELAPAEGKTTDFIQLSFSNNVQNCEQVQELRNPFRWYTRHQRPETSTAASGHWASPAFCRPLSIRQKLIDPQEKRPWLKTSFTRRKKKAGGYICLFFVWYSRNHWGNNIQACKTAQSYTFSCLLGHPELVLSVTVHFHTFLQPFERLPWVTAQ